MDTTTIAVSSSGSTMITLSSINDGILEGNETIIISLANELDIPNDMVIPDPVTITITDNNGMYIQLHYRMIVIIRWIFFY